MGGTFGAYGTRSVLSAWVNLAFDPNYTLFTQSSVFQSQAGIVLQAFSPRAYEPEAGRQAGRQADLLRSSPP